MVNGHQEPKGNVTEKGLFKYLIDSGVDCMDMLKAKDIENFEVFMIPFSSRRKRATFAVRLPELGGKVRVFTKGAPDIVMRFCDKIIGVDGQAVDLDEDKKAEILGPNVIKNFAQKSYRTLLVAYCDYDAQEWEQLSAQNGGFKSE